MQWGPDAGDPVEGLAAGDQTLVARLATTPGGVELAAVGQRRVTQQAQGLTGYWAGGVDATGDIEFERTGVRFWAEALAGTSWFKTDPPARATPPSSRGARWPPGAGAGVKRGKPYFEAFATAGVLEPDTAVHRRPVPRGHGGGQRGPLAQHAPHPAARVQQGGARNFPRGMFFDFEQRFLAVAQGGRAAGGSGVLMFVVFEGIDGSGKTTISNLAAERLRAAGLTVEHLREGGKFSSTVTQNLREFGRDVRNLDLTPFAEFFLYVTRDVQLLEEMTRPALGRADVVIADRFLFSAEVLARHGRGLPEACAAPGAGRRRRGA